MYNCGAIEYQLTEAKKSVFYVLFIFKTNYNPDYMLHTLHIILSFFLLSFHYFGF
jgi:hypothetical protein